MNNRGANNSGTAWFRTILWVAVLCVLILALFDKLDLGGLFSGRPKPTELAFNQITPESKPPIVVSADEQINQDVFEKAYKAVVNIVATTLRVNFWMEVIPQQGQGSGFIVDPEGYILTNNHVVEKAQRLTVTTAMGKKVEARLVGRDRQSDLAVIKIPSGDVEAVATLGDSDTLRGGQKAIAIGNPFGLSHTLTTGVLSALKREIQTRDNARMENLIQTDAAINPGNSGGPLLNSNAQVIGINTAIFSLSGGYQGIGFAIPVNYAKEVASQLITKGRFAKPWLGITGIGLSEELADALSLGITEGVLVVEVVREGPAHQAGIRGGTQEAIIGNLRLPVGGDIITSIDNAPIKEMNQLGRLIESKRVDDVVSVRVVRDGKPIDLPVRLKERP
ncbi:MAG: trypsin-like peptidase domain-containing protein [Deltaproteobacteria bacterium]|nr:trypsin-like peptidase domain-containing protein [Deltaproteobacteria bacterium]